MTTENAVSTRDAVLIRRDEDTVLIRRNGDVEIGVTVAPVTPATAIIASVTPATATAAVVITASVTPVTAAHATANSPAAARSR